MPEKIIIKNARVHNLKNISLEIPHNKLTVITGVSGSGKSSLAFDTIFAEGQRRYIESLSPYARQFLGQMKPADVDEIIGLAPAISIDQKALSHNPRSTVGTLTEIYDYLRVLYARLGEVFCPICGRKIEKLALDEMVDIIVRQAKETKSDYVTILSPVVIDRKGEYYQLLYDYLNLGFGEARIDGKIHSLHEPVKLTRYKNHSIDIVIDKVLPSDEGRLSEAVENALAFSKGLVKVIFPPLVLRGGVPEGQRGLRKNLIKTTPSPSLKQGGESLEILLSSNWTCPHDNFAFPEVEPRLFSFNSPHGACETCHGLGRLESWENKEVVDENGEEVGEASPPSSNDFGEASPPSSNDFGEASPPSSAKAADFGEAKEKNRYELNVKICPDCQGKRLRPESLAVKVNGLNLYEACALSLDKAAEFFENYYERMSERERQIAENVVVEIIDRLNFLLQVGLNYLSLSREAETLSGGEAQRIRLSSQIGSRLSRTLYVLDEPTIGLHERDTDRLIKTLKSLRDQNNTVIVVEHDERTIHESDYLVDLGPLAGKHGGEVVAVGETAKLPPLAKGESKRGLPTRLPTKQETTANHPVAPPWKGGESKSLTLQYLSGEREIEVPVRREKETEKIKIIGARANNLKKINVEIPLRKLVGISGVSGSGKSSLLYDVLYKNVIKIKHRPGVAGRGAPTTSANSGRSAPELASGPGHSPLLLPGSHSTPRAGGESSLENASRIIGTEYVNKVIIVDQSPIGRTPRSNPATYTGIFTPIRDFFAQLPEARERGYSMSRFSFNRPGGRCEACEGAGFNLIEMHFLPPVMVECEVCHGKRFNRETLQVHYKAPLSFQKKYGEASKNIAEVLALTIDEAVDYFDGIYQVTDKLKVLQEVGLGYLQLGQSATTLSGGEAQRIKLARELTHTLGKRSLYLLDEPTVGLHYYDIELLLKVLNKLVERENTVLVIEHNMHMLKSMDYVIDLGPEGGDNGGQVVASGTPEEVAKNKASLTGKYLKNYL